MTRRSRAPGAMPARLALSHTVAAVREARRFVDERLTDWPEPVDEDARYTAELLTSELVTNALRYGAPPLTLGLRRLGEDSLRVEVGDGTPVAPIRLDPNPGSEGGRGIVLLDTLAASWGCELLPRGKVVWYELPLGKPPPAGDLHW